MKTLSAKRLAHRLTRHCETDSEKVVSIHRWITHHIKYDVKRFYSYSVGQKAPSVRKVLWRRKAICSGYSELFASLCRHSGVAVAVVSGYAKGPYYDQGDLFYRADHAWNAVKVNDEWLLTDATWDAGQIRYFRRSLGGRILHFVSFGKLDHIRYRPHFVRNPTNVYLMRNGPFMKVTHLPEIPIWQLLKPVRTAEQMEQDSSFYFGKVVTDTTHLNDSLNPMRDLIAKTKSEERLIEEGHLAFAFNHRNHEAEANALLAEGISKRYQLDVKTSYSRGSSMVFNFHSDFNLCQKLFKSAALHNDTSLVLLGKEIATKMANLGAKEGRLKSENQELIQQTKKVAGILKTGIRQVGTVNRSFARLGNNLYRVFNKTGDFKKFNSIPTSRKSKKEDSIRILKKVNHLIDSASNLQPRITHLMAFTESQFNLITERLRNYGDNVKDHSSTTKTLTALRMLHLDDRDYTIRRLKDNLIRKKKESDTQVLTPGQFSIGAWCDSVLAIQGLLIRLNVLHRLADQECVNLRRSCVRGDVSSNLKKMNLSQFGSVLQTVGNFLKRGSEMSYQLKENLEKLILLNELETKEYGREKKMGLYLYGKTRSHFNAEFAAGKYDFMQKKIEISSLLSEIDQKVKLIEKRKNERQKNGK